MNPAETILLLLLAVTSAASLWVAAAALERADDALAIVREHEDDHAIDGLALKEEG